MTYAITMSDIAIEDLALLKKSEPHAFKKAVKLLQELKEHPYTGSGHPEAMKYGYAGYYSRRISIRHRMVYRVLEQENAVFVAHARKHYDDK
jgi:toxin YoeB